MAGRNRNTFLKRRMEETPRADFAEAMNARVAEARI
jgi:hypothetical protein